MAAGKIVLQASDGSVTRLMAQDGSSGECILPKLGGELVTSATVPSQMSKIASSVLLNQSSLSFDDTAITKNFATVTYDGNGTTQDTVTGISSVDFTVSGNGSGYWLDRTVNQVKTDAGDVVASGSCVVNTSKVHIKRRSGVNSNARCDGLRGAGQAVYTDSTLVESDNTALFTSFNNNGFTVEGANTTYNGNTETYIAYQTLYTHMKWGVTSQGKFQIEAYNPVTREGMIYFLGSGLVGHQISHSQGVEIDYTEIKDLSATYQWTVVTETLFGTGNLLSLDNNWAAGTATGTINSSNTAIEFETHHAIWNTSGNAYIMYYKCKSETFTIGLNDTNTALVMTELDENGNVSRLIEKNITTTGDWKVIDYQRGNTKQILLNSSTAETTITADTRVNGTGDSYFDLPTDDSNINITGGYLQATKGKDKYGFLMDAKTYTGSLDFTGVSDGIKYIGLQEDNTVVAYDGVSIGSYEKQSADDNRLVFNTEDGKWYEEVGSELVTNGTFDSDVSGWTAENSAVIIYDAGRIKVSSATVDDGNASQTVSTEVGVEYILTFDYENEAGNIFYFMDDVRVNTTSIEGSGIEVYTFVAENTTTKLGFGNGTLNGGVAYFDNISVYKVEPTLSVTPTDPISFLPYPIQIQSETPQAIMYDMERIPENVMGNTMVDGDLEVNGGIKSSTINIQDLPTVDPFINGELWNSSNTIKLSVGA